MPKQPLRVDLLVGRNIRSCRLRRGLTQSELGGHLGVTPQQIQKYENGANRVGAQKQKGIDCVDRHHAVFLTEVN